MVKVEILNLTKPLKSKLQAGYCESFLCKLRGLTFRRNLPMERGLLLVEKMDDRMLTGIHMLFVFFKLGIVWINNEGIVVDTQVAKPWVSFLLPKEAARYVLEIVPERISEFRIGDKVNFEEIK